MARGNRREQIFRSNHDRKLFLETLDEDRNRIYRGSLERRAPEASRAEQLLREGLRAAGLDGRGLLRCSGADPRKVAIARAIWEQTVVPQKMAGRTVRDEERSQRESATASQSAKCQAIGPPALPPEAAFIRRN